jgi:hypothetical protein
MVCQSFTNIARKAPPFPPPGIQGIGFCDMKNLLQHNFLHAIRDLNSLLAQQTQAVIEGDSDFVRFDLLIHMAQEKKEMAKYAWIAHVESHRCDS